MTNEQRPLIRTISLSLQDQARIDEHARRTEIRNNFLVPIHIMWTSNTSDDASKYALAGVVDAIEASGQERPVAIIGSQTLVTGDYENADWYAEAAYSRQTLRRDVGYGLQLDTSQFYRLFANEPLQENPHWDVLIVNSDLNALINGNFINFVYGETNPSFPYSVQSIRRIEGATNDTKLNLAMVRNLLRHEVGHMFGLVRRPGGVESLGTHCPNICSMKQVLNIRELAESTIAVENQRKYFCNDCIGELSQRKDRYKPLPK